jgi:hypothetical protein
MSKKPWTCPLAPSCQKRDPHRHRFGMDGGLIHAHTITGAGRVIITGASVDRLAVRQANAALILAGGVMDALAGRDRETVRGLLLETLDRAAEVWWPVGGGEPVCAPGHGTGGRPVMPAAPAPANTSPKRPRSGLI